MNSEKNHFFFNFKLFYYIHNIFNHMETSFFPIRQFLDTKIGFHGKRKGIYQTNTFSIESLTRQVWGKLKK